MAIARFASQCPNVQVSALFPKRSDAYASSSGTAPSARSFTAGEVNTLVGKLNENALLTDLAAMYGSSRIRAIAQGLTISFASGMISVAAGHALIDGIVELSAGVSGIAVVSGWNYVWLLQAGTVQVVTASTAAPSAQSCFIGAVNVVGSVGTVDTSGVVYDKGGIRFRQTADTNEPSDTPNVGVMLFTKTAGGLYLWDGGAWQIAGDAGAAYYLSTLPYSSGDSTTHDDYAPDGGVHWTPGDRDLLADINVRDAVGDIAGETFDTAKLLLDDLTEKVDTLTRVRTGDPTGVTEGWVWTADGSDGASFAAPTAEPVAPLDHAASHATGGGDPIAPSDIGAEATANKGIAGGYASLDGSGKVPSSQLPAALLGAVSYVGTWNASTNSPTLASGTGTTGAYYLVATAGSTTIDGISSWSVGDNIVFNGTAWQKVSPAVPGVTSVNGATGAVSVTPASIGAAETNHDQSADTITSGTLPIARGGTGGTTASTARTALGLGTASVKDVPSAGVAATASQVVIGDDPRFRKLRYKTTLMQGFAPSATGIDLAGIDFLPLGPGDVSVVWIPKKLTVYRTADNATTDTITLRKSTSGNAVFGSGTNLLASNLSVTSGNLRATRQTFAGGASVSSGDMIAVDVVAKSGESLIVVVEFEEQ